MKKTRKRAGSETITNQMNVTESQGRNLKQNAQHLNHVMLKKNCPRFQRSGGGVGSKGVKTKGRKKFVSTCRVGKHTRKRRTAGRRGLQVREVSKKSMGKMDDIGQAQGNVNPEMR